MRPMHRQRTATNLGTLVVGLLVTSALVMTGSPADAKYKEIEVANGSTIKGTVTWKGEIPKLPPLRVFKHMDKCGQKTLNPALIVDENTKGVKFTAVWLAKEDGPITKGKPIDFDSLERDHPQVQHAGRDPNQRPESLLCNFEEHVFAFVRTEKMAWYNMEDLLHNPHVFKDNGFNSEGGGATIINQALPDRNRLIKKRLRRVKGIDRCQCDTHVHMNCWMLGFGHPYFDVTGSQGEFEITNVPPGNYRVIFWHEGYNIKKFAEDNRPIYDNPHVVQKKIEVKAGQTVDVNATMPTRDVKVEWKLAPREVEGH